MKTKKYLFITGGNGELGKSIIKQFHGYEIISPNSQEMDCSNINSITDYIESIHLTQVDVFVHCAGVNFPKSYLASTDESIFRTMQIDTFSFLFITQALTKYFIDSTSKIIAISSIYGSISRVGRLEYTTSKSALNGMIKALALELAPRGIMVNSISPGFIETSLTYRNNSKKTIADIVSNIPVGRMANKKEIAWFVKLLSSPQNQYLTGQNLIIDGGYTIGGFQK
jgi:3-oxoacyl-[acyl-carrier protein] reductase